LASAKYRMVVLTSAISIGCPCSSDNSYMLVLKQSISHIAYVWMQLSLNVMNVCLGSVI